MTAPYEAISFYRQTVLAYEGDECLIWPYCTVKGYGQVWDGSKMQLVSRLVCREVHGEPPTPKHDAAHSCGRGQFGCVTKRHLRWATRAENQADRLVHGTSNRGERHGMARLSDDLVNVIRRRRDAGELTANLAIEYGVSRSTISRVTNKRLWQHIEGRF